MKNSLYNLSVYQLSRDLSKIGWDVYSLLDWQTKKIIGDQFIRSIDSVGANIAEGYGRFHYLGKIKFYYNARGSFYEAVYYWAELLIERNLIDINHYNKIIRLSDEFIPKLNAYINSIYNSKKQTDS